jgi:hypothetical protein
MANVITEEDDLDLKDEKLVFYENFEKKISSKIEKDL